jgi:hypothetical protein
LNKDRRRKRKDCCLQALLEKLEIKLTTGGPASDCKSGRSVLNESHETLRWTPSETNILNIDEAGGMLYNTSSTYLDVGDLAGKVVMNIEHLQKHVSELMNLISYILLYFE